jgi:hypothetical protein
MLRAEAAEPSKIALRYGTDRAIRPSTPDATANSPSAAPLINALFDPTRSRATWAPSERISTPWVYAVVIASAASTKADRILGATQGILGRHRPWASITM